MNFKFRPRIATLMSAVLAAGLVSFAVSPVEATTPTPSLTCSTTPLTIKALVATQRTFDLSASHGCTATNMTVTSQTYKLNLAVGASATDVKVDISGTPTTVPISTDPGLTVDPSSIKLTGATAQTYSLVLTATAAGTDPNASNAPVNPDLTATFAFSLTTGSATAPTCTAMTGWTQVNEVGHIDMVDRLSTIGLGCSSTATLTFIPVSYVNGTVTFTGQDAAFTPTAGYVTPQDWTDNAQRASFTYYAQDEYGQKSPNYTIYVLVSAPVACSAPMKTEVVFNNPTASAASQFAITNRILNYIDCAQSGSVITMSWFSLTDFDFVTHLQQAKNRGVDVRFLINSHATKSGSTSYQAWSALKGILGTGPADNARNGSEYVGGASGSWAMYCDSGCLTPPAKPGVVFPDDSEGEYPALHSKFFMISNINGSTVVGVASSNPTRAQAVNGWNNAQIYVNKKGKNDLFDNFNAYFAKLAAQGCTVAGCSGAAKASSYAKLAAIGDTSFTTFPHPGGGPTTDDMAVTFQNMLNTKSCTYRDAKGKLQHSQIYVNMFVFTRNTVAMKLWQLASNPAAKGGGCNVHIIYTDMDQAMKNFSGAWLNRSNGNPSWGSLDCISTPTTTKGKFKALTVTTRTPLLDEFGKVVRDAKGKKRYTTAQLCSRGILQGRLPTINMPGGYCWLNSKSKVSGGSIDACLSTPVTITGTDPADNRTKLEAVRDSNSAVLKYSHQKYVLIQSWDKTKKSAVYTTYSGTPNITQPGLRWNDEIMVTSTSADIYAQYLSNYNTMKKWIKGRAGSGAYLTPCKFYTTC